MKQNKEYVGWYDIDMATTLIVTQIQEDQWVPRKVCGVARGGVIPAVIISHQLNIPFEPITPDTVLLDGKDVLIVDDIYDSGKTIKHLKKLNPQARFATVLFNEQQDEYGVDYYGNAYSGNEWIVFPWESDLS